MRCEVGRRQRGRAGDEQPRAARSAAASRVVAAASRARRWYIVGTPKSIVAPASSASAQAPGSNRPRCQSSPPRRSGPEQSEHEAVHVEQRQARGSRTVVGRPLPGVGEGVEVRGQRAAREHGALGQSRRARRVDDQRRVLGVAASSGSSPPCAATSTRRRRGSAESGKYMLWGADQDVGAAVVRGRGAARLAELRVHRDDRRTGRRARRRGATQVSRLGSAHTPTRSAPATRRATAAAGGAQLPVAERTVGHPQGRSRGRARARAARAARRRPCSSSQWLSG